MQRRSFLERLAGGAALGGLIFGLDGRRPLGGGGIPAAEAAPARTPLKIAKVRAILTAPPSAPSSRAPGRRSPGGIRLVVVKVETSEPSLYGLGCATFTQRARAVVTAIDQYLSPFLAGKDPDNIEDLWQAMYQSSYWRNGPVLMNALSGVDMALWDIKGKRAGLPVYQLLGGKCRAGVPVYRHASGRTAEEVVERAQEHLAEGVKHVRVQVAVPGSATYGARGEEATLGEGHFAGERFEPAAYQRALPKLFEHLRRALGEEVELLHDVHERLHPIQAIAVAKELERYHLFFLEDPFAPEDIGYFKHLRAQCATPIAMGELFNNPNEWLEIISGRLIDFIRCHLSQVGGISAGRKIAALADFFRVRTAWHGPGDVSPVGHAANLHLDLATWNFGIQEYSAPSEALREVFPGAPEVKSGMLEPSALPGLGVDLNEELAARYPIQDDPPFDLHWGRLRGENGTIRRP